MMHGCTPRRLLALLALLFVAGAGVGCESTPTTFDDPNAVFFDNKMPHSKRWAAAKQAKAEQPTSPERIKTLEKVVWMRGHLPEFSNYGVDELIAIDEAKAKVFLADAIILAQDWRTITHILDIAVERNWVDFVPAIVRLFAKTTPAYTDDTRPERAALAKLRPDTPIEEVILEVFVDAKNMEPRQRAAAWQLMNRLTTDKQRLMDRLMSIKANDPLVIDLQASARDLGIIPDNLETVTWLQVLRLDPAFWEKAKASMATLSPQQKRGMKLRHIAIVSYLAGAAPDVLKLTHADLLARAGAHDRKHKHYLKSTTFDGGAVDYPQRLIDWDDKLAWGDLAAIVAATIWMNDRGVVEQWFKQAHADHKDRSTEYGGLMLPNQNGRAYPKLYKPVTRLNDRKFIAPKTMIFDAYTALAHYHYHAQSTTNQKRAGPGRGDMKFTARHQYNNLVLTFIDENRINVDYYQAPGIVVDLGTVSR